MPPPPAGVAVDAWVLRGARRDRDWAPLQVGRAPVGVPGRRVGYRRTVTEVGRRVGWRERGARAWWRTGAGGRHIVLVGVAGSQDGSPLVEGGSRQVVRSVGGVGRAGVVAGRAGEGGLRGSVPVYPQSVVGHALERGVSSCEVDSLSAQHPSCQRIFLIHGQNPKVN